MRRCNIRYSADKHAQTSVSEHGDRHSTRPAGAPDGAEAARRVARGGRAAIDRQHPSSRGRGAEGLRPGAASLHSGHFRGTGAPNRGPGRTLIPGDGAAGDQRAQNRPACPAMRLRDACGLSRNDFLALWSQAHVPSCNRQVTSTSIHMARPGPASAPRGYAPLYADTLSLTRTISDRRLRAAAGPCRRRWCWHADYPDLGRGSELGEEGDVVPVDAVGGGLA